MDFFGGVLEKHRQQLTGPIAHQPQSFLPRSRPPHFFGLPLPMIRTKIELSLDLRE